MNLGWLYALSVVVVGLTLPVFSYLTLIYRELGRMTTGRVHAHLDIFEAEIEPKLKINRRSGGRTFRILGHFLLAFLVLETTRGVVYFVPGTWESFVEFCVFLVLEVVFAVRDPENGRMVGIRVKREIVVAGDAGVSVIMRKDTRNLARVLRVSNRRACEDTDIGIELIIGLAPIFEIVAVPDG